MEPHGYLTLGLASAIALSISLALPVALLPILRRARAIDLPSERSSHSVPAIRGVGIGPSVALGVGYLVVLLGDPRLATGSLTVSVLGALAFAGLGSLEDLRGVSVAVRAGVQLAIGIVAVTWLTVSVGAFWVWVPVLGVGVAAYVNVANFMDGVDGISGLHAIVAGATFGTVGLLSGSAWLLIAGAIVAAAFLAFLPWNILRRGTFLGDSGSYFLGAFVALVISAGLLSSLPAAALLGVIVIYVLDVSTTFFRRLARGERWYTAHRAHLYQRMVDAGAGHLTAATVVAGLSAVCATGGILVGFGSNGWVVLGWMLIVAGSATYAVMPRLIRRRQSTGVAT